jgi:hypothetical protein
VTTLLQRLESTLRASVEAVAAGDLEGAASAAREARAACAALQAAGARLPPDVLARLTDLHGRGSAAARTALDRLHGELGSAGRSRRAATAYGRR